MFVWSDLYFGSALPVIVWVKWIICLVDVLLARYEGSGCGLD